MRTEYLWRKKEIVASGHDRCVYGERVKAGYLLKVITCYLHMPDSGIGDIGEILVDNGGIHLEIRSRSRDAAKQGLSALNPFYVGEHQRVIGCSPGSDVGDILCLTVIGEKLLLKSWRKGKV